MDRDFFRGKMTKKYDGGFSANLVSLELQLKTLLDGAGGSHAVALLDALSQLNGLEQEAAIRCFTGVLKSIANGESRFASSQDKALKDFEENLYREILDSMREASRSPRKFEVLSGGKDQKPAEPPINLNEARRQRGTRRLSNK